MKQCQRTLYRIGNQTKVQLKVILGVVISYLIALLPGRLTRAPAKPWPAKTKSQNQHHHSRFTHGFKFYSLLEFTMDRRPMIATEMRLLHPLVRHERLLPCFQTRSRKCHQPPFAKVFGRYDYFGVIRGSSWGHFNQDFPTTEAIPF